MWPARHDASSLIGSQYPPMGQCFRLKAECNISEFSPDVQVILRAMKKYGIILADNGSNWFISGAHDSRWDDTVLGELKSVLELVLEAVDVSSLMDAVDSAAVNGFSMRIEPTTHVIKPGEHTTFTVQTEGIFSGNITLTLSITPPMTYSIQPISFPVADTATFIDAHSGILQPGIIHMLNLTATGGEFADSATARILVGGWQLYLPLILR